jgi:hypothetical protein
MNESSDRFEIRAHLEREFGPPRRVEAFEETGDFGSLDILRFDGTPTNDSTTLVTIGASDEVVIIGPGSTARLEYAISAHTSQLETRYAEIVKVLGSVARLSAAIGIGWAPGAVVPLSGPVLEGLLFETVYSADSSFWPPNVRSIRTTSSPVYVAWLIPVHSSESTVVRERGWEVFETALKSMDDMDPLDLRRPAVASLS